MLKKYLTLAVLIPGFIGFFGKTAGATQIEAAGFNSVTGKIEVQIVYEGGFKTHQFELQWDSCLLSPEGGFEDFADPSFKQVAARLVDSGWDDTGKNSFHRKLSFSMEDSSCRPAVLTLFSGKNSRARVLVPAE